MKSIRLQEHRGMLIVYLTLIVLIFVSSLICDGFLTERNFVNILRQAGALGLVCIGQTFAILTAGIDLSIGSVVSLTSCLSSGFMDGQAHLLIPIILLVLGVSLFIGFMNGLLITKTGVPPIIVTLGMASVVQGVVLLYTKRPIGSVPDSFGLLAWGKWGFMPFPFFMLAAASAIGIIVLRRTVFGRYVYATGANEGVARLAGIQTHRVKIGAYMICGFCAGLTGLFLASRMGMGDPLAGEHYMLDSIVPVLIGGTILTGGKGGIVGTIGGVFVITILSNTLNFIGVSSYWQWILQGLIIILAVAFYWKQKPKK